MKCKLYVGGLILISLVTYSCSVDDGDMMPELKNRTYKSTPPNGVKIEIKEKIIDSTTVIINTEVYNADGDPINPIPPRD